MKKQLYELNPEHEAQLKPWADKWITNAMRTRPMDDDDRSAMIKAVKGLYAAADLTPPPDHRIVFVPSPFVLRFAGGFAAAIWHMRKNPDFNPSSATASATDSATASATDSATDSATHSATRSATHIATYIATDSATRSATEIATDSAASGENEDYFYCDVPTLVRLAAEIGVGQFGLKCAQSAFNMRQGGNQWSAWASFLSFFRHVAKLDIDYSKWEHWENAAIHGGPRIMHQDFCMISDFPTSIKVDAQNRPHCETGPFTEWSDGSKVYALHGVYVPAWVVETPRDKIDPKKVLKIPNTEARMAAMRHVGLASFLSALKARCIDKADYESGKELYLITVEGQELGPYLKMTCPSTGREFLEGVGDADKYEKIDPTIKTCLDADEWRRQRACAGMGLNAIGHQGDVVFFDFSKKKASNFFRA